MHVPPHLTIAGVVRDHAKHDPDRVALTFEGASVRPDQVRTYGDLWRNGQAMAHGLHSMGYRRGDIIATLMANHAEVVELLIASAILGTIVVPIDPRTRGEKLRFMIRDSAACALVMADYALPQIAEIPCALPDLRHVFVLATDEGPEPSAWPASALGMDALRLPCQDELPHDGTEPDSAMEILFTSGTTGDPKGIVLTHRRYCTSAKTVLERFGYTGTDTLYSGLSLTHGNAQTVTLGAALCGGLHAVFSRRFTKSRLWDIARQYGCTTLTLLGGMPAALYAEPPRPGDRNHRVRLAISAGMPAALWRPFEQRFGARILEFYGQAEGGMAFNPVDAGPVGSIGRPSPNFIHRIVDEQGHDVPAGASGELLLRHADGQPYRVDYVNHPEASAVKCADGWLHTGDMVHEDAQGWLFFDHRKGNGIRRNGDFINTAFVEKAIAESGLVDDVYVYGVKAASGAPGEKDVVAAVVPARGKAFNVDDLFASCRARLETNFVPSFVQVLEQIPKTASEKPQDRVLIEALKNHPQQVHKHRPAGQSPDQQDMVQRQ